MADAETAAWICTACGYIHEGAEPPDNCPMCAVPKDCFVPYAEPPKGAVEEDDVLLDDSILGGEDDATTGASE